MCNGMVALHTRAPSSSSSSILAHRLALPTLLILFTLLQHGRASGCAQPPSVQNGNLLNQTEANRDSFPVGAVLTYGCESGFTANGPASITCENSGSWSSQPPNCIRSNVCSPPTEPENGGYRCHPPGCRSLTHKTVIEYFCDEGYTLKTEYKFLTCENGEWVTPMQISCRLTQDTEPSSPLGIPALSIVASTASSVALILLLVVLFVLVQPKLKSFHHNRREQGVSGQSGSVMVEGVQVALPSYEEAVYGNGSGPSPPSPPDPAPPETRVPIVLSEGLPQGATGGQGPSGTHQHRDLDLCLPSTSSSFPSRHHAETVLVHQAPSSSSSLSSWAREHPGGACAGPLPLRRDSESSDQHSLLSVTSADDFSDDIPLLKEA
ncbi:sushi domain-containing protein 6 [Corythoichthys intestinalis]|uniref:sushi domain-containing protein 6 n=1 Tax=Corythoichthys intestinalis TaxID=161448 RepID=UPI0025A59B79|nr:sushi domain-containing protein 6 [Corythoichthys intestinalis]XP_061807005.1 sushi domain-containing protein 6-like [Nerophis lumbriciformis]